MFIECKLTITDDKGNVPVCLNMNAIASFNRHNNNETSISFIGDGDRYLVINEPYEQFRNRLEIYNRNQRGKMNELTLFREDDR